MQEFLHIVCSVLVLLGGGVFSSQASGGTGLTVASDECCSSADQEILSRIDSACCGTSCTERSCHSTKRLPGNVPPGCCFNSGSDSEPELPSTQKHSERCPCSSTGCGCVSANVLSFLHFSSSVDAAVLVSSIRLEDDLLSIHQESPGPPPPRFQNSLV